MTNTLSFNLENLSQILPESLTPEQKAKVQTLFFKNLALHIHRVYGGKIQTVPKVGAWGLNWFNVFYTPGVSAVSTAIRDDHAASFALSNRGNLVAVVSDSTRVLGDGDCTPSGGLGVMEGKAQLMNYLGGIDAMALCVDSRGPDGKNDPQKIIDFVKMLQPSFGAVNLEDISQPNCFRVLDELREACDIPVWHDDAQGTACVTLAGLVNALKLADKKIGDVRIVLLGAGASNTTIARLILADGGDPAKMVLFDTKGSLHAGRADIEKDARYYRKWELCQATNPERFASEAEALKGADVLIALSTPGPDTVKREWVRSMAERAIVFVCANPVPEIYPYAAKEEGAFIVATGRGDFPNQVNNSVGFPGILKGALLVRARKITDGMAITAAHSIAQYASKRGITTENIIANMSESDMFAIVAADVGAKAIEEGVAREPLSWQDIHDRAARDIEAKHATLKSLEDAGLITPPEMSVITGILEASIQQVLGK